MIKKILLIALVMPFILIAEKTAVFNCSDYLGKKTIEIGEETVTLNLETSTRKIWDFIQLLNLNVPQEQAAVLKIVVPKGDCKTNIVGSTSGESNNNSTYELIILGKTYSGKLRYLKFNSSTGTTSFKTIFTHLELLPG
jgi:hypothetical protein